MTSDEGEDGYRVGYGKPPKNSQFQKGESGNRKGRRKGSKNFATIIHEELNQRVSVTENGSHRSITKLQALIKQVINKAASGDSKAMRMLIQISKELGDLKLPAHQKERPIITMKLPELRPGEDRSYRDGLVCPADEDVAD
jgi:hypothetical protein